MKRANFGLLDPKLPYWDDGVEYRPFGPELPIGWGAISIHVSSASSSPARLPRPPPPLPTASTTPPLLGHFYPTSQPDILTASTIAFCKYAALTLELLKAQHRRGAAGKHTLFLLMEAHHHASQTGALWASACTTGRVVFLAAGGWSWSAVEFVETGTHRNFGVAGFLAPARISQRAGFFGKRASTREFCGGRIVLERAGILGWQDCGGACTVLERIGFYYGTRTGFLEWRGFSRPCARGREFWGGGTVAVYAQCWSASDFIRGWHVHGIFGVAGFWPRMCAVLEHARFLQRLAPTWEFGVAGFWLRVHPVLECTGFFLEVWSFAGAGTIGKWLQDSGVIEMMAIAVCRGAGRTPW
ncbi:hypothetical protein C8R45DRAFT_937396 [Mycena sanguinolenta]|nr:hypothetical protein C8R45DRAFT_937396 [Mycena sanguinolenta]